MIRQIPTMCVQLFLGLIGAGLALWAGLPMPFLLGSLVVTAGVAMAKIPVLGLDTRFPPQVRQVFTAMIGAMIGQSFTPELLSILDTLWISLLGVAIFVLLAHPAGYLVYRRLGGYDKPTAIFASVPGGLIEAISFCEQAGGNVSIVSVQHFARVILVIVVVPLLFFLWTGDAVGSAAGEAFSGATYSASDVFLTIAIALIGLVVGPKLRLPAGTLVGPLILSALVQVTGVFPVHAPFWMLSVAQLVVGVGLGSTFAGVSRRQLVKSLGLGTIAMSLYLVLGIAFAVSLSGITDIPLGALFASFAPGGLTEMSLIALSLNIGPIIVAAHHVFRISVTVLIMTTLSKRLVAKNRKSTRPD